MSPATASVIVMAMHYSLPDSCSESFDMRHRRFVMLCIALGAPRDTSKTMGQWTFHLLIYLSGLLVQVFLALFPLSSRLFPCLQSGLRAA
ncbi:hypothetical protein OE88DRAFT_1654988 [Heliocybe sulcata]|uniref:Uncharacterized protein n=1 Tax=Heliocybe sulcata TaxID=5364 RepID=A0A5C3NAP7_9AGAM|nr:hypothetical protein OE88DRAFT_1654988 [Heliocybe sulcata]